MRSHVLIVLLTSLLVAPTAFCAQPNLPTPGSDLRDELRELKSNVSTIRDTVEIIKRDQVNYKIEKDLLTLAYSSNLQTVNLVITIVLGVFAILSYFGLKGIPSIKSDYSKELDDLKNIKNKLDTEIQNVISEQKKVKEQLVKIDETNRHQDTRLKVLEIKEKVQQLMEAKKYALAVEYADAGLALDSSNVSIMHIKGLCHSKLAQFQQCIDTLKPALGINRDDRIAIVNSAEAYLMIRDTDGFEKLYKEHQEIIDKDYQGAVRTYFFAMRAGVSNDLQGLKDIVKKYVDTCPDGAVARMGGWQFDEATWFHRRLPNGAIKTLFGTLIAFLKGEKTTELMKAALV